MEACTAKMLGAHKQLGSTGPDCKGPHLSRIMGGEAKALAPVAEVGGHHPGIGRVVQVGRQQLPIPLLPVPHTQLRQMPSNHQQWS